MYNFTFNKASGPYDVYYNDDIDGFLVVRRAKEETEPIKDHQFESTISNIIDKRVPQV